MVSGNHAGASFPVHSGFDEGEPGIRTRVHGMRGSRPRQTMYAVVGSGNGRGSTQPPMVEPTAPKACPTE